MEKTLLHSSKLAKPAGIFSSGVKVPAGEVIFVSGQVARDAAGETEVKSLVSPDLIIEIEAIAVLPHER